MIGHKRRKGMAGVEARGSGAEVLPARSERRPKRIKVRPHGSKRVLTYHIYGRRPKRGEKVRILAGLYEGDLGTVVWRHSLYGGATYLARVSDPAAWT